MRQDKGSPFCLFLFLGRRSDSGVFRLRKDGGDGDFRNPVIFSYSLSSSLLSQHAVAGLLRCGCVLCGVWCVLSMCAS